MRLHLNDPETARLAPTIAQITGETLTQVVKAACLSD